MFRRRQKRSKTVRISKKTGKKVYFTSPAQLQKKIDDYINNCPDTKTITRKDGTEKTVPAYTITGLIYHLGFKNWQSFYDYAKKEGYADIIARGKLFVEKEYEKKLSGANATGIIFALKNMGWKEKIETENVNNNNNTITIKWQTGEEVK